MLDWLDKLFQSLTVGGVFIFMVAFIGFLFTGGIFLMKREADRYAWFVIIIVAIFFGAGLSKGLPKAVEYLTIGLRDSAVHVPEIQRVVSDMFDMIEKPWGDAASPDGSVYTVNGEEVTLVPTGAPTAVTTNAPPTTVVTPPTALPAEPTATPTPVGNEDDSDSSLEATAHYVETVVVLQQLTATYTPRPPDAEPTYDPTTWNPATPPPTPVPGG